MKKYLLFFIPLFLISCSGENDSCPELEPVGNEFTLNCNTYELSYVTAYDYDPEETRRFSNLYFTNIPVETVQGTYPMENINWINIQLNMPKETAYHELAPGTYNFVPGIEYDPIPFTLNNDVKVNYDNYLSTPTLFSSERILGYVYDSGTMTITKDGDIYTFIFEIVVEGNIVKGKYVGIPQFKDA